MPEEAKNVEAQAQADTTTDGAQLMVIAGMSAVLFFFGLLILEPIPEIPVDIDQKPFFIPLMLVALLPLGRTTMAVAAGAALGEAMGDLLEGYEIDDPAGFVGYIVGFTIAGIIIGNHPQSKLRLTVAAIAAAASQAVFEAATFLIFGSEGLSVALWSWAGNTVTHGLLGGAVPLLLVVPMFYGRIERLLGYAPGGSDEVTRMRPLADLDTTLPVIEGPRARRRGLGADPTLVCLERVSFAYPATERPALREVSLSVRRGEVTAVVGPMGSGKSTLCLAMAGLAPRVTGGQLAGHVELVGLDPRQAASKLLAERVGLVVESYEAQRTELTPFDEVLSPLLTRGVAVDESKAQATELLLRLGVGHETMHRRSWELSGGEQMRTAIAAGLATDPDVVILDAVTSSLDPEGVRTLTEIVADLRQDKAVVVVDRELGPWLDVVGRILVLDGGRIRADGPADEVLADDDLLRDAGVAPPVRSGAVDRDGDEPQGEPAVRVEGLSVRYPDGTQALSDLSLAVRPGEIHAVLGGTAAGKSTLVSVLNGMLDGEDGTVVVDGRDLADVPMTHSAELVGSAPQNPDEVISERDVATEVAFPLRQQIGRLPKGERPDDAAVRRRVEEVCDLVGLDRDLLGADPRLLEKGRRKLVLLAEALVLDPPVIALDEPTAGLDATYAQIVTDLLVRLRDEGKAVLVADHDVDLAVEVADTVTVLVDGRVHEQGAARAVLLENDHDQLTRLDLRAPKPTPEERRTGVGT